MTDPIIRKLPPRTQRVEPDPYYTTLPMVPYTNAISGAGDVGPPQWRYPPGYAGLRDSAASSPRRELSISTTAIDAIIPCVYGETQVTGVIAAASNDNALRQLIIGVIFAYGEQDSITSILVNDEDIAGLSWIAYNAGTDKHVGDGSTALSSKLTSLTGWSLADTTRWQNRAHVVFRIDTSTGEVPPSITVKATLGGMLVTDFRTSAEVATVNPAVIGWHMMTATMWRKLSEARLHSASWETVADWCDDVMADSTARWTYSGAVYQRDVDAALMDVLGSCFAATFPDHDGKIRLWAEKAPTALSDTWSASGSTTITADTSSGAALTEVAAGDWLIIGNDVREVASVTNNDTIVLALAITCSAAVAYPIEGNVHIQRHHVVRHFDAVDVNDYEVPYKLRARYTAADDAIGGQYVEATLGADTGREEELTLSGCDNASVATRWAKTFLALRHYELFSWRGVVDGIGVGLEPGDLVVFDKDIISPTASSSTRVAARVMPPVEVNTDGTAGLTLRQFDPDSYSVDTAVTPGSPGIGDPWDTAPPDEPTGIDQQFIEGGNWDDHNLVPDEDDLSAWSTSNVTITPGASGSALQAGVVDIPAVAWYEIAPATADTILVSFIVLSTSGTSFYLGYGCNSTTGDDTVTANEVRIDLGSGYRRYVVQFDADAYGAQDPCIYFRMTAGDRIDVGDVRVVSWAFRPSISLIERWTWTEGSNAEDTVDSYQLVRVYQSGRIQVLAEAPQGRTSLQAAIYAGGAIWGGDSWTSYNGSVIKLRVVGKSGIAVLLDADTQSVGTLTLGDVLDDLREHKLSNAKAIQGIEAGGTARDMLVIDSSDYVQVGNSDNRLVLNTDDEIWCGGNLRFSDTYWDDIRVNVNAIKVTGASQPTWTKVKDNGSGSSGVYSWVFSASATNECWFECQLPHGYKEGSSIYPHVHWAPTGTDTGDCRWGLEYTWASVGSAFGNTTIIYVADAGDGTAYKHQLASFDPITGTSQTLSSVLLCRLFRDGGNGADTLTDTAVLLSVDFHVEHDSLGSDEEFVK